MDWNPLIRVWKEIETYSYSIIFYSVNGESDR